MYGAGNGQGRRTRLLEAHAVGELGAIESVIMYSTVSRPPASGSRARHRRDVERVALLVIEPHRNVAQEGRRIRRRSTMTSKTCPALAAHELRLLGRRQAKCSPRTVPRGGCARRWSAPSPRRCPRARIPRAPRAGEEAAHVPCGLQFNDAGAGDGRGSELHRRLQYRSWSICPVR